MTVSTKLDLDIQEKARELWITLQQLSQGDTLSKGTERELVDLRTFLHELYGDL